LAESGGIEKDASLVLILDMPQPKENETNRECKMRIAKHRNGPLLSLAYTYRSDILTFEEAA
jgi:replicative DNA helicase